MHQNKDSEDSDFEENAPKIKPFIKKTKKAESKSNEAKRISITDNTQKKALNRLNEEASSEESYSHNNNSKQQINNKFKQKFLKKREEFEANFNAKKNFNRNSASNSNEEEGYSIMRNYNNKQHRGESESENRGSEEVFEANAKTKNNNINNKTCNEKDIFCQCKNHPRYRPCVCLAFPNAEICVKDFCKEDKHKLSYECNPKLNCNSQQSFKSEICKCKNSFDASCACKLNPLAKDCFCKKYPISHLCNSQNCSFEKESIFCKCADMQEKRRNSFCQDYYCKLNANAPQCFCILNPEENYCKCLNDPAKCESML